MKIMTGIDLHSNNALCGLMDENGRRVLHKKLPCDLPAILQVLEPYKARIAQVAVESTYNWYWLVDGLEDHGYPVVLANPARMKQMPHCMAQIQRGAESLFIGILFNDLYLHCHRTFYDLFKVFFYTVQASRAEIE